MTPDETPAQRLAAAMTACNDAAYTVAFKSALDAVDTMAAHLSNGRGLTKDQAAAAKLAYCRLAGAAMHETDIVLLDHGYQPALLSHACGERLRAMATEAYETTLLRYGVRK